jgi:hypothetical protein
MTTKESCVANADPIGLDRDGARGALSTAPEAGRAGCSATFTKPPPMRRQSGEIFRC